MKTEVLMRMQRELKPQGWLAVMVAMLVMTVLAGYLYVLKPDIAEHRALSGQGAQSDIEEATGAATRATQEIARLEVEVESLNERLWGQSSKESADTLESFVIDRLDQASAIHDVHLESVKPGAIEKVLIFDELHYDVVVGGDYFALYGWLASLEQDLRPLVIKRFEIENGSNDQVKMDLRLVSYRPRGGA